MSEGFALFFPPRSSAFLRRLRVEHFVPHLIYLLLVAASAALSSLNHFSASSVVNLFSDD